MDCSWVCSLEISYWRNAFAMHETVSDDCIGPLWTWTVIKWINGGEVKSKNMFCFPNELIFPNCLEIYRLLSLLISRGCHCLLFPLKVCFGLHFPPNITFSEINSLKSSSFWIYQMGHFQISPISDWFSDFKKRVKIAHLCSFILHKVLCGTFLSSVWLHVTAGSILNVR